MLVPIIICVLRTVPRGLERELEELQISWWIETIQTAILIRSVRIQRKIMETWGNLLSPRHQENAISWRWHENPRKKYISDYTHQTGMKEYIGASTRLWLKVINLEYQKASHLVIAYTIVPQWSPLTKNKVNQGFWWFFFVITLNTIRKHLIHTFVKPQLLSQINLQHIR